MMVARPYKDRIFYWEPGPGNSVRIESGGISFLVKRCDSHVNDLWTAEDTARELVNRTTPGHWLAGSGFFLPKGKNWDDFMAWLGSSDAMPPLPRPEPKPVTCKGKYCPDPVNPHGEPNQKDGSYLCYSCRNR